MSRLVWDETGKHFYETGVDHAVLYRYFDADPLVLNDTAGFKNGNAWNGVTAFNESPSGAEPTAIYADNIKYLNLISAEDYGATVEFSKLTISCRPTLGRALYTFSIMS